MKRNVWADMKMTATVNSAFIPVMIDVDEPDAAVAITRYRVGVTPYTIVIDSQVNVLRQKQGGMGEAEFLELRGNVNLPASKDL